MSPYRHHQLSFLSPSTTCIPGSKPALEKSSAQQSCASWSNSLGSPGREVDRPWRKELGEVPSVDHQFPSPGDGLLLEVITEGPVAQHLKEGVVVRVSPTSSRSLCLPPARMHFGYLPLAWNMRTLHFSGKIGELVHPRVGKGKFGESGIKLDRGTIVCCFSRKKSRKELRVSALVMDIGYQPQRTQRTRSAR
jgi:hypothetical protein